MRDFDIKAKFDTDRLRFTTRREEMEGASSDLQKALDAVGIFGPLSPEAQAAFDEIVKEVNKSRSLGPITPIGVERQKRRKP